MSWCWALQGRDAHMIQRLGHHELQPLHTVAGTSGLLWCVTASSATDRSRSPLRVPLWAALRSSLCQGSGTAAHGQRPLGVSKLICWSTEEESWLQSWTVLEAATSSSWILDVQDREPLLLDRGAGTCGYVVCSCVCRRRSWAVWRYTLLQGCMCRTGTRCVLCSSHCKQPNCRPGNPQRLHHKVTETHGTAASSPLLLPAKPAQAGAAGTLMAHTTQIMMHYSSPRHLA